MGFMEGYHPQSIRHIYYKLTNPRLPEYVAKTDNGYELVQREMTKLRRSGRLPYSWVEDMSRRGYHVVTYGDAAEFLLSVRHLYRADLWRGTGVMVEVWCESRSIAGVIHKTCRELGVSLYPAGGNSSISFAYQAACGINEQHGGRLVVVLYVGDWDQAGVISDVALERELRRHLDPDVRMVFHRLAITEEQIEEYDLPTKPRKESDRRSPQVAETVEAEAMPPEILDGLLREAVEAYLPPRALEVAKAAEASERQLLKQLADALAKPVDDD